MRTEERNKKNKMNEIRGGIRIKLVRGENGMDGNTRRR